MTAAQTTSSGDLSPEARRAAFIVIPAYNEGACLERVVRDVRRLYPNVVVVDDGSTDDTLEAARRSAAFCLRHAINRGQGAALQTGIEYALLRGAGCVVTFDADGQHDPADIAALLAPICAGECDVTLGSRALGRAVDMPASRRVLIWLSVRFTRWVSRVRVTDTHNGLRAFSRRAAQGIHITLDRMAHASELLDLIRRSGWRYREVAVRIRYTPYSLAKGQSPRGAVRILIHYLLGRIMR